MYPKEYLLRDKQESDIENDPRSIVNAMLISISGYQAKSGSSYLELIFRYVVKYLQLGADPTNP